MTSGEARLLLLEAGLLGNCQDYTSLQACVTTRYGNILSVGLRQFNGMQVLQMRGAMTIVNFKPFFKPIANTN